MAETYSVEYQALYRSSPPGHSYAIGAHPRLWEFSYTQVLAGASADTILLGMKLPPQTTFYVIEGAFEWATFTATATLDLGWQAYTDVDGVVQVADADGLIDGLLLTTDSTWSKGMLLTATPDDSKPVVNRKVFNNRDPVPIFATIGVAAPGVGATLHGHFMFKTP